MNPPYHEKAALSWKNNQMSGHIRLKYIANIETII